ncbi:hypothetical protein L1887_05521 [Cichorium endivia]|nr:hypothetical protein L1887_05521 [Cichorium endivia]
MKAKVLDFNLLKLAVMGLHMCSRHPNVISSSSHLTEPIVLESFFLCEVSFRERGHSRDYLNTYVGQ